MTFIFRSNYKNQNENLCRFVKQSRKTQKY